MARIKKEVITQEDDTLSTEINPEITDDTQMENILSEEETTLTKTIPEYIDHILKMYPQYKELYIDNKRGVYTSPTPQSTLYHNPHFNK